MYFEIYTFIRIIDIELYLGYILTMDDPQGRC